MKVGDYVRSKYYGIKKILNIYDNNTLELDKIDSFGRMGVYEDIDDDMKSSPNIIDLIEVGDYVNGMKIIDTSSQYYKLVTNLIDNNVREGLKNVFINSEKDIKSIVTHEQFERMQYKVGE